MRAVAGSWLWGLSGAVTALVLTVPAVRLVAHAGSGASAVPSPAVTLTVQQPVRAVNVSSDGAPVRIAAGPVSRVTVTEPALAGQSGGQSLVADGRLTLFPDDGGTGPITVTVPRDTAVTLTTDGGPVSVTGLSGSLTASSGGGSVRASDLTSENATVTTAGGPAALSFGAPPGAVAVLTQGGPARIGVPGGPYALDATNGGGQERVEVATDPAAKRTLTVSTGGGPLMIGPPSAVPAGLAPGVPVAPAAPAKPAAR